MNDIRRTSTGHFKAVDSSNLFFSDLPELIAENVPVQSPLVWFRGREVLIHEVDYVHITGFRSSIIPPCATPLGMQSIRHVPAPITNRICNPSVFKFLSYAEGYDHLAILALAVEAVKEQQKTIEHFKKGLTYWNIP